MRGMWLAIAAVAVLVSGCAPSYTYDGTKYPSSAEALAALRMDLNTSLTNVQSSGQRLGGRAIVAIPTRDVIEANGIRRSGTVPPSAEITAYLGDFLETTYLAEVDALRRGRVFDQLTLLRDPDPKSVLIGDNDYKVWLLGDSPGQWQWYVSRKGSDARQTASVDAGAPKPEKLDSFRKSVINAAVLLGAHPIGD